MQAWILANYGAAMTQDVLTAMRQCFPCGFIPSWSAIEESSQLLIAQSLKLLQMYRTPFVRIQFDVINDVKVYALEALLKYEAGFPDGILATVKEGEHIRLVIVSGTDGFNCIYFLNTLVGTYLIFAILPPYRGARLFDIYNGNQEIATAQNSAGQLDMVDTVGLFAH